MIWVVVPFSRPANLPRVLANFRRQRFPDKKLCVVENGPAVGTCRAAGVLPDLLLTSGAHQSLAKNEALAELRWRGGGFWTTFDDDDWYGAGHLAELFENRTRATAVGRLVHFVRLSDGLHLFDRDRQNGLAPGLAGPTISCRVEDAVDFPEVSQGEDAAWCRTMAARGATFWGCSIRHFVYDRRGTDHAWRASDVIVRRQYGDALHFRDAPDAMVESPRLSAGTPRPAPAAAEVFAAMGEMGSDRFAPSGAP